MAPTPRTITRTAIDEEWMKHTLWFSEGNRLEYKAVVTKPLTVDTFKPKPRTF